MATIDLKLPRKLKRVEIIRSEELEKFKAENYEPEEFEKDKEDEPEDLESEKDAEPEPDPFPLFTHQYYFQCPEKPRYISLDNLPPEAISLDEAQTYIQEAYDRGFSEGQQVTKSELKSEIEKNQEWVRRVDSIVEDLNNKFGKEVKKITDLLPDLAVMISKQIIGYEVENDESIVIRHVQKALAELNEENVTRIRLHPDNVEMLKEVKSSLVSDESYLDNVEITGDERIDKLGCIIESSAGKIDGTLNTQLLAIKDMLRSSVDKEEDQDDNV